ncbi:MAG: flagellar protein FlaG [Zoogloea sp.]|uniref:flagellar protein FlaG n=1 Tax=Zoogloea sp. TaxID=49181 RepID=UPI002605FA04|nr:flagellar protein FlaG [Zoogloea sp.]MDD2990041.1 flagellar protein FlaG [Zoogloea sp.]
MSIQSVGASSTQYAPPVQNPGQNLGTGAVRTVEATPEAGRTQETNASKSTPGTPPTSEQLNQAVKQIQDVIKQTANSLQFSIDEDIGVTVVKVIDTESKKVIRQIPSEEVMDIAKALDKLQGLLVKQKV